jgi:hypothetical protein
VHSTVWLTPRYFALIGGSLPMTEGIDGKAAPLSQELKNALDCCLAFCSRDLID